MKKWRHNHRHRSREHTNASISQHIRRGALMIFAIASAIVFVAAYVSAYTG